MKETAVPAKRKGKRKGAVAAKRKRAKRPETPGWSKPVPEDQRSRVGSDSGIEEALRAWRLAEARRRGVPAFRILSDQALRAMATRRPGTVRELLAIPGIGITTVEKYARQFYRILQKSGG
jgi:DNA topoisomerase-3